MIDHKTKKVKFMQNILKSILLFVTLFLSIILSSNICSATHIKTNIKSCSPEVLKKIQKDNINLNVIKTFYNLQNTNAKISAFAALFAKNYKILDLAFLDVPKKSAANIEKRITAFRKAYPGYKVITKNIMADGDNVFIWFEVITKAKKPLLNSFVLFTLKNGKITKAVEVAHMNK